MKETEERKRHFSERELEARQAQVGEMENLRVFVADIVPPDMEKREAMEDRMIELENLVTTYGGVVILEHIQKRSLPDYNTYIGGGKLDEIMHEMELQEANLLILGNILKPHQIYKINEKLKAIGAAAWDRVDLILKIFEKNARTEETKLQIELAAIKHMGPRIFGMGMELSRQGGGSKLARGKGETNTEIMKRHLRERELDIKKTLEKYKKVRETHRQGRKKKGLATVGIVGYTNAGKSSLLNILTGKGVLAENKLFATLGTSVGKMWLEPQVQSDEIYTPGKEILLSDTIGFIRDLPPKLVDAFASTLEDSIESDILLHVIDVSDEKMPEKREVVEKILQKIGACQRTLIVFNKTDRCEKKYLTALKKAFKNKEDIFFISTYTGEGIEELKSYLGEIL
ncbi:GTPase HflX [Candidatus Gracilibacteria bacterium]|nr:GTPase HflX [Candidatus Gracilibacteria bacterium]